jgi:serine protease Do
MKILGLLLLLLPSQDCGIHDVIEDTVPKVVKIFGASGFKNLPGYASGVIVSPEGHILTVRSVMLQARDLRVVLWDGRVFTAEVLRSDRQKGISLLKIDAGGPLPHFDPEDPGPLRVGQWVLSIANAFKLA